MTAERLNSRLPSRGSVTADRGVDAHQPAGDRAPALSLEMAESSGLDTQKISGTQILIALLLTPLAWLAQVGIADMVLGGSCAAGSPSFVVHSITWTPAAVAIASVVCLLVGSVGVFVAWRNLLRTVRIPWRFPSAIKGTRAERDWFVSRICAMSSTMFILGLVATEIATLVIAPCSPW